ncbi:MAG: GNAT family N-acetyltransferase [Thermoproteota archaeon]
MQLRIRAARRQDREEILSFCQETFSWGDYIDRVWDRWFADSSGRKGSSSRLFVAEEEKTGRKIAMSHVALCPGGSAAWLEGVRVHPDFRRSGVATMLLERMLAFAGRRGAGQASAIVADDNLASQRMMERNGFAAVSRWVYCSSAIRDGPGSRPRRSNARFARAGDLDRTWQYLQGSPIYEKAAGRYVKSWQWYALDRDALRRLIAEKQVAITTAGEDGDDDSGKAIEVDGLAVINRNGYWDRRDVLQVVYLDSSSDPGDLLSFASSLCAEGRFSRMHVICPDVWQLTAAAPAGGFGEEEESERFLLYSKVITPRR